MHVIRSSVRTLQENGSLNAQKKGEKKQYIYIYIHIKIRNAYFFFFGERNKCIPINILRKLLFTTIEDDTRTTKGRHFVI